MSGSGSNGASANGIGGHHLGEDQMAGFEQRTLAPDDLRTADRHLAGCAACRRALLARRTFLVLPDEVAAMEGPLHLSYEQISAYVDGLLPADEKEGADAHLFLCVSCRREVEDLQRLEARLAELPIQSHHEPAPGVHWLRQIREFFAVSGRMRALAVSMGVFILGFVLTSHAARTGVAGLGSTIAAEVTSPSGSAHPVAALGGMLLMAGAAGYFLYSLRKRK